MLSTSARAAALPSDTPECSCSPDPVGFPSCPESPQPHSPPADIDRSDPSNPVTPPKSSAGPFSAGDPWNWNWNLHLENGLVKVQIRNLVGLMGDELGRDEELCVLLLFIGIVASLCSLSLCVKYRYRVYFKFVSRAV